MHEDAPISKVFAIVGIKVLIGMVTGFIIDLIFRETHKKEEKKNKKNAHEDFHVCEEEHCHCEEGILKSSIIHTFKTLAFILLLWYVWISFQYRFNTKCN